MPIRTQHGPVHPSPASSTPCPLTLSARGSSFSLPLLVGALLPSSIDLTHYSILFPYTPFSPYSPVAVRSRRAMLGGQDEGAVCSETGRHGMPRGQ
jgi:hypothetical protein